jgi:hypothetical protein
LPTYNHYRGADGGYVAVYTREQARSIYGVGDGIYVIGQLRVQGRYIGRVFYPAGYGAGANITCAPALIALAYRYLPSWRGIDHWVGGDTGGWFGVSR